MKNIELLRIFKKKERGVEEELLSNKFLLKHISTVSDLIEEKRREEVRKELLLFYNEGKKQRKRLKKELKTIDLELQITPNNRELLKRRIEYSVEIHPEEGLNSAKILLEITPEEIIDDAYALYARVLRNCRKHQLSMDFVEKSLAKNPKNGLALKVKAALLGEPEFSESISEQSIIDLTDEAINSDPTNIYYKFEKIWALKETKCFEKASRLLEECRKIKKWNHDKIYYGFLAALDDAALRSEDCLINSLKSVLLEPRTITGLCMLSIGYDHFNMYTKSLEMTKLFTRSYIERVGDLDDNQKLFLANNYFNCGEYEKCMEISSSVLENGISSQALINLGYCYFFLHDYPQAVEYIEKAIDIDLSSDAALYRSFGLVCYETSLVPPKSKQQENQAKKILEKGGYALVSGNKMDSSVFDDIRNLQESGWDVILNSYLYFFSKLIEDRDQNEYYYKCHKFYVVRCWLNRLLGNYFDMENDMEKLEPKNEILDRWEFMVEIEAKKDNLRINYDISDNQKFILIPKLLL